MAHDTLHRDEADPGYQPEPGSEPEARNDAEARNETDVRNEPETWGESEVRNETETWSEPEGGAVDQPVRAAEAVPTATATAPVPEPGQPAGTEPATATLWAEQNAEHVQERWRELQLRFVDDPRTAAEQAQALVTETLESFTAALTSRKQELDAWDDGSTDDGSETERMRKVVRGYRDLLDRLLEV